MVPDSQNAQGAPILPTDEEDDCCVGELIEHGQFMFVHSRECQRPKAQAYWSGKSE